MSVRSLKCKIVNRFFNNLKSLGVLRMYFFAGKSGRRELSKQKKTASRQIDSSYSQETV